MQLQYESAKLSALRAFASPARCPQCGDWMIAPIASEFVEGGEIRHLWYRNDDKQGSDGLGSAQAKTVETFVD